MELKIGYKHTEIGILPEDWEIMSIDQIFQFHSTSNFSKAEMQKEGEIGCFHYGLIHSIQHNNYDIRNGLKYFITKKQAKYEFLKDGDVVMVDASEDLSGVNKSVEISGVKDKLHIAGLHTYLLRDRGFLEIFFRGPMLNSYIAKTQYYRLAVGMKVFGVSKKQLKSVLLPVPTKAEQVAIAKVLSDSDSLIISLKKLIDKKRQIKQAVMQELLKPKDGWKKMKLGDLGKCLRGVSYNPERDLYPFDNQNSIRLLRSNNIQNNKLDYNGLQFVNHARVKKFQIIQNNDIIICMANGSKQLVGKAAYFTSNDVYKYTFGAFMGCFRTDPTIANSSFVYHNFLTNVYRNYIDVLLSGSSINNLNPGNIESIEIAIPNLETQNSIAEKLNDFEFEIDLLNQKLSKANRLKEGIMHNLLTGKIRLT